VQFDDNLYELSSNSSGEFQVNTYTSYNQSNPSTTALNDGGFIITWTSSGHQDGDGYGIYAQRYDADGNVNGTEFQVNTYTTSYQFSPSTTALNDGSFVITWTSSSQDGSGYGIYAKRYNDEGLAVFGSEFKVNTYTIYDQDDSSITTLADGGFVITWESINQDGSYDGVYAQRYDANGTVNGSEFQVNTYTSNDQSSPSTTALADGGFVVTWESINQDGSTYGIYAQRYDSSGDAIGAEFRVNTYKTDDQSNPSTTALNDGGFVITWQSDGQDGSNYGIYAQRYDASGNIVNNEFNVSSKNWVNQSNPKVTTLVDGGFVITWQSSSQDGSGYGIYAQRYDANGTVNGTEFQVNTYTTSEQSSPSATALNDGGFVITWTSSGQDGSYDGVYAQRYDADGRELGQATLIIINEITGTINNDILQGDGNIDKIATLQGADVVYADDGNDIVTLTADAVWEGDYLAVNMSYGDNIGTGERINLNGFNQFNDVIDGGGGVVDTIILTDGSDAFFLDNIYTAHHSSLTLESTTRGVDSTKRIVEIEVINAGKGDDIVDLTSDQWESTGITINGEAGNDTLWGFNGDDTINGGEGDDTIFGGNGDDTLSGGSGSNIFQFTATSGSDVIIDFDIVNDSIQLFYKAEDKYNYDDLILSDGLLTWTSDYTIDGVSSSGICEINLTETFRGNDLANFQDLSITFVEIV